MTTNQALIALALLPVVTMVSAAAPRGDRWTDEEVAQLSSLSLGELGAPPPDPTNRVADDPHAAEFGRKLFFDTRLSVNGQVSCATCHIPEKAFQDGTPLAKGVGVTNRARCRSPAWRTAQCTGAAADRGVSALAEGDGAVTILTGIPGAHELVGKGVYRGMPKNVPKPLRNRHAVVVGTPAECTAAARQLGEAGWKVTVVTREKCGHCDVHRECRLTVATELVCATGVEYLEALVLRRIESRRLEAFNASALSIL